MSRDVPPPEKGDSAPRLTNQYADKTRGPGETDKGPGQLGQHVKTEALITDSDNQRVFMSMQKRSLSGTADATSPSGRHGGVNLHEVQLTMNTRDSNGEGEQEVRVDNNQNSRDQNARMSAESINVDGQRANNERRLGIENGLRAAYQSAIRNGGTPEDGLKAAQEQVGRINTQLGGQRKFAMVEAPKDPNQQDLSGSARNYNLLDLSTGKQEPFLKVDYGSNQPRTLTDAEKVADTLAGSGLSNDIISSDIAAVFERARVQGGSRGEDKLVRDVNKSLAAINRTGELRLNHGANPDSADRRLTLVDGGYPRGSYNYKAQVPGPDQYYSSEGRPQPVRDLADRFSFDPAGGVNYSDFKTAAKIAFEREGYAGVKHLTDQINKDLARRERENDPAREPTPWRLQIENGRSKSSIAFSLHNQSDGRTVPLKQLGELDLDEDQIKRSTVSGRDGQAQKPSSPGRFSDSDRLLARQERDKQPQQDDAQASREDKAKHIREAVTLSEINHRIDSMPNLQNRDQVKKLAADILSGTRIHDAAERLENMPAEQFKQTTDALKLAFQDSGIGIASQTTGQGEDFLGRLYLFPELADRQKGDGVLLTTRTNDAFGMDVSHTQEGYRFSHKAREQFGPDPAAITAMEKLSRTAVNKITTSAEATAPYINSFGINRLLFDRADSDNNLQSSLAELTQYRDTHLLEAEEARTLYSVINNFNTIAGPDGQISANELGKYQTQAIARATALAAAHALEGHPEHVRDLSKLLDGALYDDKIASEFEERVNSVLSSSGLKLQVGQPQRDDRHNEDRQLHFIGSDGKVLNSVTVPVRRTRSAVGNESEKMGANTITNTQLPVGWERAAEDYDRKIALQRSISHPDPEVVKELMRELKSSMMFDSPS